MDTSHILKFLRNKKNQAWPDRKYAVSS